MVQDCCGLLEGYRCSTEVWVVWVFKLRVRKLRVGVSGSLNASDWCQQLIAPTC